MAHDPNQMTPSGLTYAQIDAREAVYVSGANNALDELRGLGCRWWSYSVSHRTFEIVVGDPLARTTNLVTSLAACEQITGPVDWPGQQLKVIWHNDREAEQAWMFVLEDVSVGFRAVGGVFGWRRRYDLLAQGGLRFGRGSGPESLLTCEQAERSAVGVLRRVYGGRMGHNELMAEKSRVLDKLPVVSARADPARENHDTETTW
jgi:hypothetical protein